MSFTVRQATPADAREIARVHVASWRSTYQGIVPQPYLDALDVDARAARWEELLRGESITYVAEDAGGLCGFVNGGGLREPLGTHDCEINAIYVMAEAQRLGIGRELLCTLVNALSRSGYMQPLVWVLADNPSRTFYAQMDGKQLAEKPIEIAGAHLVEVAYGWESIDDLLRACAGHGRR